MADETNMTENGDAATADAPAPKKRGAPRRAKATADAVVASTPPKTEKVIKERKKRGATLSPTAMAKADKPVAVATKRGRATTKPAKAVVPSRPASASDEMSELLQLEEENKRLRQALAEKLRAENTDLRKRLGLA